MIRERENVAHQRKLSGHELTAVDRDDEDVENLKLHLKPKLGFELIQSKTSS